MKKIILIVGLFLMSTTVFGLTGYSIMKKNSQLSKPKSAFTTVKLKIYKGNRAPIVKKMKVYVKTRGKNTKSRITFTYPTSIEFLIWNTKGQSSQQWIKLSSGRVRKVASGNKGNSWSNSHFYYADLSFSGFKNNNYKYLGEATFRNISGKAVSCYKVKAVQKRGKKVYSKRIIFVGKNDSVIRKVEFFEKGRHTKTLSNYKIKKINGIYTPRASVMKMEDGTGKTILFIKSIKYNLYISDAKFKRSLF